MHTIVLLALLGSALAVPSESNRITGGTTTTIETYPYTASVQFGWLGSSFSHSCGGSLITETVVLTAAHCIFGLPAFWWRVRLGSSYRSSGGSYHNIDHYFNHPMYNIPQLHNDISVIFLKDRAVLSNRVATVRLAGRNSVLPDGIPVNTVGWGVLGLGLGPPTQLQQVTMNIINQQICTDRYANRPDLPNVSWGMFCAGILDVGGKGSCIGDSGGPVVYFQPDGPVQVGIVSWGYGCGHVHYPGVYVRVSYYIDWILNVVDHYSRQR